jgi:hypothetical protein
MAAHRVCLNRSLNFNSVAKSFGGVHGGRGDRSDHRRRADCWPRRRERCRQVDRHQIAQRRLSPGPRIDQDRRPTHAFRLSARRAGRGVTTIQQELTGFDHLSIAENLLMGEAWPRQRWGGVDWAALYAEAGRRLTNFGLTLNTHRALGEMTAAEKQEIAIAGALARRAPRDPRRTDRQPYGTRGQTALFAFAAASQSGCDDPLRLAPAR